jgi:hypothetical protein
MRWLVVALTLTSCAPELDLRPSEVECHDLQGCPSDDQLNEMEVIVAGIIPGFNPEEYLFMEWHADDEYFFEFEGPDGDTLRAYEYTPAGDAMACTSYRNAGHGFIHIHAWRSEGYGDALHELPLWKQYETRVKDTLQAYGELP